MTRAQLEKIYRGGDRINAIKLFCMECMGYTGHRQKGESLVTVSEARALVKVCQSKKCPHYPYRGWKKEPVEIDWL